jgi:MFS family permease
MTTPRSSALAPFRVRAFRFQWPADLAASWAMEMEMLILGWYVLVETRSVLMLTIFASLQYVGTLLSPMFGVMGDRIGHRVVLCAMRGLYATLACVLMTAAFMDAVTPTLVLVTTAILGLVKPSDIGMRTALVGETVPSAHLMPAMSIQRTTQDSARIAGALTGAGLVAVLGMSWAYVVVVVFYGISLVLSTRVIEVRSAGHAASAQQATPWRDLKEGMSYVWRAPHLRATMVFAFLLNLTAFPLFTGLMPYVAKEVYGASQTTLGTMVASAASGSLIGSIIMIPLLFIAGMMQTMGLIPISTLLLRTSDERYRGRIMGIRMMAIYGNLPGLLLAGPLIANFGYSLMATAYCIFGLLFTFAIALYWRTHLWQVGAPANRR